MSPELPWTLGETFPPPLARFAPPASPSESEVEKGDA